MAEEIYQTNISRLSKYIKPYMEFASEVVGRKAYDHGQRRDRSKY